MMEITSGNAVIRGADSWLLVEFVGDHRFARGMIKTGARQVFTLSSTE